MPILEIVWRNGIAQLHGTPPGEPRIRKSLRTRDPDQAEQYRVAEEARLARTAIYGAEQETTFAQAAVLYQLEKGPGQRYLKPIIEHFGDRRIATIKPGEIRKLAKDVFPNAKASTRNRSVVKPARAIIKLRRRFGPVQSLVGSGIQRSQGPPRRRRSGLDRRVPDARGQPVH
jgi:hypothetical protein